MTQVAQKKTYEVLTPQGLFKRTTFRTYTHIVVSWGDGKPTKVTWHGRITLAGKALTSPPHRGRQAEIYPVM